MRIGIKIIMNYDMPIYCIRKKIEASSAKEALKLERKAQVDAVYRDEEDDEHRDLASAVGFAVENNEDDL